MVSHNARITGASKRLTIYGNKFMSNEQNESDAKAHLVDTLVTLAEPAYLIMDRVVIERKYNPKYGDNRLCKCGHQYHRHFDSYEGMEDCGCKYCSCDEFSEAM